MARYVQRNGGIGTEGTSSLEQCVYLAALVSGLKPRHAADVGFNAGHSAYAMLYGDPKVHITSFDIGDMPCVPAAKRYIDFKFPGRHALVIGDTRDTLPPTNRIANPFDFDFAFIDGGHSYEVVDADLDNLRKQSIAGCPLVIDDLTPWNEYGKGPTRAWQEALLAGTIVQEELVEDGHVVTRAKPPGKRVWALGRFK